MADQRNEINQGMRAVLILVMWLVMAWVARGLCMGDLSHEFPEQRCAGACTVYSLAVAPLALTIQLFINPSHHWRTHDMTCEERWRAFHRDFSNLSVHYFNQDYDCDLPEENHNDQ